VSVVVETDAGLITVPDPVLVAIAVRASESVDGVRVRRRRTIDTEAGLVRLSLAVRRGEPLVEVAERTQAAVADALRDACALEVTVDVSISELV
jgi:uncharacterized alkaline shock family protein YloU